MVTQPPRSDSEPWLSFRVGDVADGGVDARSLANLLTSFADAMRTAARVRLGMPERKAGRLTAAERHLAALRVVSVKPGSVEVELSEPPPVETQQVLLFDRTRVTPDLVVTDLIDEFRSLAADEDARPVSRPVRRAAIRLASRAAAIGGSASIFHRPAGEDPVSVTLDVTRHFVPVEPDTQLRTLVLFGHAYMLDVEQGRERVRIKLPSQLDATMNTGTELRGRLDDVLDQPVKATVQEIREDGRVVDRRVLEIERLELNDVGPDRPPRSVVELAALRGLTPGRPPPYVRLAEGVWPEDTDIDDFDAYWQDLRARA